MALAAGACVASALLHISSVCQLLIHRFPCNGDHDYEKTSKTSSRLRIAGVRDSYLTCSRQIPGLGLEALPTLVNLPLAYVFHWKGWVSDSNILLLLHLDVSLVKRGCYEEFDCREEVSEQRSEILPNPDVFPRTQSDPEFQLFLPASDPLSSVCLDKGNIFSRCTLSWDSECALAQVMGFVYAESQSPGGVASVFSYPPKRLLCFRSEGPLNGSLVLGP